MRYKTDNPCFRDFILVRESCKNGRVSTSNLYIEDLEGLSLKRVANIADARYKNGEDLALDKVAQAIRQVQSQILALLNQQGVTMPQGFAAREFVSLSSNYHAPSVAKRGVRVVRAKAQSPFSSFVVETLTLKSNTTGAHTIELLDESRAVLESRTVDLIAGQAATVPVNWKLFNPAFYVVFNQPNATPAKGAAQGSSAGCCGSQYTYSDARNRWFFVQGWDGTQASAEAFGIGLRGNIQCELENLLCYLLPYVANAVLWLAGVGILNECLATPRQNYFTILGEDWAREKRDEWQAKADQDLERLLPAHIQSLKNRDSLCIVCDKLRAAEIVSMVNPMTRIWRDAQADALAEYAEELQELYDSGGYKVFFPNAFNVL